MPLLNYTTKVPVERTVAEIHRILSKAGANAILNEYEGSEISGIKFRLLTTQGEVYYSLPANIEGVRGVLRRDKEYRDEAHCRRVAWRIIKDWIEAQMAIIAADLATLDQVFLPYANTATGETVYERISNGGLKLLGKA